jgi:putative hemolysin
MTFDLLFLFILLVANGVFAMAEIALVASRSVRLEQRADAATPVPRLRCDSRPIPPTFFRLCKSGSR